MSVAYLELNKAGNLVIPGELLKESGFELIDRVRVEIAEGKMVLEREAPAEEDIDRELDALVAEGVLEPDGLGERLKPNVTRTVTFEELDAMFKGKLLPIEEIIRYERESREAYLRDGFRPEESVEDIGD
ncbi:MAG: hypothetical protein ACE5PV_26120 [Candidatus Poribacteria bacterium]